MNEVRDFGKRGEVFLFFFLNKLVRQRFGTKLFFITLNGFIMMFWLFIGRWFVQHSGMWLFWIRRVELFLDWGRHVLGLVVHLLLLFIVVDLLLQPDHKMFQIGNLLQVLPRQLCLYLFLLLQCHRSIQVNVQTISMVKCHKRIPLAFILLTLGLIIVQLLLTLLKSHRQLVLELLHLLYEWLLVTQSLL